MQQTLTIKIGEEFYFTFIESNMSSKAELFYSRNSYLSHGERLGTWSLLINNHQQIYRRSDGSRLVDHRNMQLDLL